MIDWTDVTDPSTLSARIEPAADLSGLLDSLESVAMAQIIEGVKRVVDFLRDVQSRGVFQQKIPVLTAAWPTCSTRPRSSTRSASELENNPPLTISDAIAADQRRRSARPARGPLPEPRARDRPRLQLHQDARLDLSFNLDDQLNAGILEEFVDVNASAPVTLSLGGTATLGLVIDLSNPTSPVFSPSRTRAA